MVDVQTISIAVASASVTIAAIYYMWQIRHQTKIRKMDFIMRMPSTFLSKEVFQATMTVRKTEFKNYDEYEEKCGVEARQVADFGENLGFLVRKKLVDISLVADRYDLYGVYDSLRPWIEETRKRANNPSLYEWFEYVVKEMKKREQKLQQSKP